MINPTDKGAYDKHFSYKKEVCYQYVACRYCDAPPYFQANINHKTSAIHLKLEIEQKKIKFNITTI